MKWESKQEMCRLFNKGNETAAIKVVVDNIKDMDDQAWDMFLSGTTITRENLYINIGYHTKIYDVLRCLNVANTHTMRIQMRAELYKNAFHEVLTSYNKSLTIEYLFSKGFQLHDDYMFMRWEGFLFKFYIIEDSFWHFEAGDKKFEVDTIARLCFLTEFLTGKKWEL